MPLSSSQIYYLRRWLQKQTNPLLLAEINTLTTNDLLLLHRIKALPPSQQEQLATLVNIHEDLQKNRYASTSIQNLESQIFALLQIQEPSGIQALLILPQADLVIWLETLNRTARLAQRYLGKVIVRNYWCGSKPISAWLTDFEVGDSGYITYKERSTRNNLLHPEQETQLKQWLAAFIQQCHHVLPKFSQMLMEDMSSSVTA